MKYAGKVLGSSTMAVPVYMGKNRVDVHKNITKVTEPDPMTGEIPEDLYEYDEWQYTRDEYYQMLGISEQENEEKITEVDETAVAGLLATTDLYEELIEKGVL